MDGSVSGDAAVMSAKSSEAVSGGGNSESSGE